MQSSNRCTQGLCGNPSGKFKLRCVRQLDRPDGIAKIYGIQEILSFQKIVGSIWIKFPAHGAIFRGTKHPDRRPLTGKLACFATLGRSTGSSPLMVQRLRKVHESMVLPALLACRAY
jgi:hypothetical protein